MQCYSFCSFLTDVVFIPMWESSANRSVSRTELSVLHIPVRVLHRPGPRDLRCRSSFPLDVDTLLKSLVSMATS
jgi:hypothetical protein